jgi:hypothetical protein
MTTQLIKIMYRNILETGTVSVTTEDTSFPKYRLYDRDIGLLFKATAYASPFAINVDQGASNIYEVDRLIIPEGHNLNNLACSLRYSTDNFGSDDHEAIGWTQGDALLIDKTFTAQAKQYLKLNITAPERIIEMPECYLTKAYIFARNPSWGFGYGNKRNIAREESLSGYIQKTKWGEPRIHQRYDLTRISDAQRAALKAWDDHCEGSKSFYIEDILGTLLFAELVQNELGEFKAESEGRWGLSFEVMEVLA